MQVTVSQIVKAIEVLSSVERSSMTAYKDPLFVGKLQAEAWLAMWPLKHALEEAQLKVTVEE